MKRFAFAVFFFFLPVLSFADTALESVSRTLGVMGTDLKLEVFGEDPMTLEKVLNDAVVELERIEALMTDWKPSPLTRLNDQAGSGAVRVPSELASIIRRSLEVSKLTGGAFDISYGAIGRLWSFSREDPRLPKASSIRAALKLVGYEKIQVDEKQPLVTLPSEMTLGLGGIAKGYGVDRAMGVYLKHGIEHGIVNAGGDLKVLGKKNGKLWEIAIKHPRERERVMALLRVSNTCVVTSGDYERFFEVDGKRYHHIIDPRTGYPSTGAMSATVVAQSAEYADALATALTVLSPQEGLSLVERLHRVEAIVVGQDGRVHATSGLQGALRS